MQSMFYFRTWKEWKVKSTTKKWVRSKTSKRKISFQMSSEEFYKFVKPVPGEIVR